MTLLAKQVVRNKCWIVEDDGTKIASILANEQGVTFLQGAKREHFANLKMLADRYNIVVDKSRPTKIAKDPHGLYGYQCDSRMHNVLWDVQKRLPVFTKSSKSKSFFCAGYYLIKFNLKWVKAYCPKLITLNRYPYQGPFTTAEEMQLHLKYTNGEQNV